MMAASRQDLAVQAKACFVRGSDGLHDVSDHPMPGSNNQDFREIPQMWPENMDGVTAIDIGCGLGLYTQELSRRGAVVIGVDVDVSRLQRARTQCNKGIKWVVADAAGLPFRNGTFELGLCVEVLGHLPPEARGRAVEEMKRIISETGRACITMHNRTRLKVARWLRLKRSLEEYSTSGLNVWPSVPGEVCRLFSVFGFVRIGRERYLNYHSRFTHSFCLKHPTISAWVMAGENFLSILPGLNRLGITFALWFKRSATAG